VFRHGATNKTLVADIKIQTKPIWRPFGKNKYYYRPTSQYGMSVIAMAHVPCIATQVGAQLGAQIFKCVHQI
jgi:hypothetical protein